MQNVNVAGIWSSNYTENFMYFKIVQIKQNAERNVSVFKETVFFCLTFKQVFFCNSD